MTEVIRQYWQVAVARRRATEQRSFLHGRIGLEKKLHEYHLAKFAENRVTDGKDLPSIGLAKAQQGTRGAASAYRARRRGQQVAVGQCLKSVGDGIWKF